MPPRRPCQPATRVPSACCMSCLRGRGRGGRDALIRSCPCARPLQEKNIKHNGNLTLKDVYGVARVMAERSCAKTFAGTVKEILGTCVSVGCTVEGQDPRDVQKQIDEGEIDVPTA